MSEIHQFLWQDGNSSRHARLAVEPDFPVSSPFHLQI
nr:MAG TPA: hypothetical protein [Caudoviricetes sp.]